MRSAVLSLLLLLAACGGNQSQMSETIEGKPVDATVTMEQVQVAYIGSGSTGTGVLYFRGRSYPFYINGLGVGGIGASRIEAEGDVYNLKDVASFSGAYAQGRYGFALGRKSGGDLWMENPAGVVMHLKAKRTGLMLSLGADAIDIAFKK